MEFYIGITSPACDGNDEEKSKIRVSKDEIKEIFWNFIELVKTNI